MPKIYNTIIANFKRTYLRAEAEKAEKRRRTFVLVMEKNCSSANAMFVSATSLLVLCMYKFVLNDFHFSV